MTAVVLRGDARRLPLPDGSVDLVVTSPPYFGLRSYTDDGAHYDGQVGSEATPAEWVAALVGCTAEWVRVLKPSGSIFVNLGDKYSNGGRTYYAPGSKHLGETIQGLQRPDDGFAPKSLLGLPWRYALACMDQLGLILRRDIIWSKPNGLPESVTDRCRSSHEYLFHFTVQPRYYAAVDEIREPHTWGRQVNPEWASTRLARQDAIDGKDDGGGAFSRVNPLGKLPGSVWTIPSQPLTVPAALGVDHFAAFPMELPRRCVLGWSPPGVCTACGEGRRPVTDVQRISNDALRPPVDLDRRKGGHHGMGSSTLGPRGVAATITGYACACTPYTEGAEICPACNCPVPSIHVGTSTTAVRGMQPADHSAGRQAEGLGDAGAEAEPLLLEGVLEPAHSQEQGDDQGLVPDDQGLHRGAYARPSDGRQERQRDAAPPSDGGGTRADADARGSGASPERDPGRQPPGEPHGDGEAGPRQRVRVNQTAPDRLPLLRSRGSLDAGCPRCGSPPTRPSLVVDPFGGTGTTALVAAAYGRTGVSVDLSGDYCRLARWRTADPAERARALLVPKPPPVPDGQASLFDFDGIASA